MVNVFSFCLYGPTNSRYYVPLLENIQIVGTHFAGWRVRIYVAPDVDSEYKNVLKSYSIVDLRETGVTGPQNMILRFFAIDEPDVDLMIVRDADSLIHWKDRWAIYDFLNKPSFVAHTIRDHKDHTSRLMGGLWAIHKSCGFRVQDEYADFLTHPIDYGIAHDQNFLSAQLYPKVKDKLLVHYSNDRLKDGEIGLEFPFAWTEQLFCGQIALKPKVVPFYHSLPRK
jgi:hypothetical protein